MNKQWMALLLSTGIAVTACPVPAAQMPPAEQIHGEAEETSVPVQHDDSDDRETANEFQSDTEPSQSETDDGAAGNEEENNDFINNLNYRKMESRTQSCQHFSLLQKSRYLHNTY